jgi:hypothetical protein
MVEPREMALTEKTPLHLPRIELLCCLPRRHYHRLHPQWY